MRDLRAAPTGGLTGGGAGERATGSAQAVARSAASHELVRQATGSGQVPSCRAIRSRMSGAGNKVGRLEHITS